MTEIKPGPGIPEMPAQPPTSTNDQAGQRTVVLESVPATGGEKQPSRWAKRKQARGNPGVVRAGANLGPEEPANSGTPSGRKKGGRKGLALIAILVGLIAGTAIGTTLPDPKNSKEYLALQSEKSGLNDELGTLQARYDNLDAGIKSRESDIADREAAVAKESADVKAEDAAVKAAADVVKKREEAVTGAEKKKEANTIREGTWTVGVDIQPGTYRVSADITDSCYWGIYRTGSNGSDIIDNDIVSGGRPSVSLSAGQDFKTTRCGSWTKQ